MLVVLYSFLRYDKIEKYFVSAVIKMATKSV